MIFVNSNNVVVVIVVVVVVKDFFMKISNKQNHFHSLALLSIFNGFWLACFALPAIIIIIMKLVIVSSYKNASDHPAAAKQ